MNKGWFSIPGEQDGERTLAEQLRGLQPALAEASGKRVLDLGCAEGWIGVEFSRAGASIVHACDNNAAFLRSAVEVTANHAPDVMSVGFADLNLGLPDWLRPPYDIVLALAILHKLRDPATAIAMAAGAAASLLVVRLPIGSAGLIAYKHGKNIAADLRDLMPRLGFALERDEEGPRGERVHYWRRVQT